MRKIFLAKDEIYHIFNRGVEKRSTFTDKREHQRALMTTDFYRFKNPVSSLSLAQVLDLNSEKRELFLTQLKERGRELVEIICYCLMPNHFHFLLKQKEKDGIKIFLSNFSNSYTRYFNTKHERVGPLFQGIFKAVRVEDDEQLMHVSRYIHLNPFTSFVVPESKLEDYKWSSLPEFFGTKEGFCKKEIVLDLFSSISGYKKYVFDQADYIEKLEAVSSLMLE